MRVQMPVQSRRAYGSILAIPRRVVFGSRAGRQPRRGARAVRTGGRGPGVVREPGLGAGRRIRSGRVVTDRVVPMDPNPRCRVPMHRFPTPPDRVVDGTVVELRLEASGRSVALTSVPVTAGGAWAGTFTVPDAATAPAGTYELIARCVVDDPSSMACGRSSSIRCPSTSSRARHRRRSRSRPSSIPPTTVMNPVDVRAHSSTAPSRLPPRGRRPPRCRTPAMARSAVALAGSARVAPGRGNPVVRHSARRRPVS